MIYALKNGNIMAYVEADSPEGAHALVLNALGDVWDKKSTTIDILLRGTVIVTEVKKNEN